MSFFLFIILVAVIWFVLIPAFRMGMAVNRVRKQARDFVNAMNGAASSSSAGEAGSRRSSASAQPQPRRRKIDPSVAETVEFEEISCNVSSSSSSDGSSRVKASCSRVEAQVTDAEWEDIPS